MKPIQALIVEDDFALGDVIKEILQISGYQADLVRNGRQAMEHLSQHAPDVVILDMHLPEISGLVILDFIRSAQRLADTRVLVVTADTDILDSIRQRIDAGFVKPFSAMQLLKTVQQLCAKLMPSDMDNNP
ncbi:MAG: response regulator [Anaerolineae bacterium]|nr:response regulator [Anaerolineae bacterium]